MCAGAAERTLQKFVVAKARKARLPDELAAELHTLGFPSGDVTGAFAAQLLARMPRAQTSNVRVRLEFCCITLPVRTYSVIRCVGVLHGSEAACVCILDAVHVDCRSALLTSHSAAVAGLDIACRACHCHQSTAVALKLKTNS